MESLFALSRTAFVLNNPDTYAAARAYLERAASFISQAGSQGRAPDAVSGLQLANYTRCVAGAYYNFALQLHQGGRLAHAVPFLEQACARAEGALGEWRAAVREEGDGDAKKEVWGQLEEQLYRRWELLGVCHAKTGDRQVSAPTHVTLR